MNWNTQDNKQYTGELDRIYVSRTEYYEVRYAVDEWLRSRKCDLSESNRAVVRGWIKAYPGRVPVQRDELYPWLDANIQINRA